MNRTVSAKTGSRTWVGIFEEAAICRKAPAVRQQPARARGIRREGTPIATGRFTPSRVSGIGTRA